MCKVEDAKGRLKHRIALSVLWLPVSVVVIVAIAACADAAMKERLPAGNGEVAAYVNSEN
jgi:hypothetical protein